jgi:Stealth protein CR2, conserved region 2/Stealth protein CR1, conserved region 1/Stealth protein CR4, conserved region 4
MLNPAVDIVYLWVDGNDPQWRSRRRRAQLRLTADDRDDLAAYSNVEGRFRDNDELRCSLRSLAQFFPDHGHIYVVTDRQTPQWLGAHPRLTIVDHRDLIPASALPTFDSGHIESYIHRIANLSERYFYFNDDVFLGAPLRLEDWFFEGGVYVGWSKEEAVSDEPLQPGSTALENACRRSIAWLRAEAEALRQAPYVGDFRTFSHAPRPMLKSVLMTLEDIAPELFESVRSTVFRNWEHPALVSDFVLRWSLLYGFAKARDYRFAHVSTGAPEADAVLQDIAQRLGTIDFFCVNDTTDDAQMDDPRLSRVRSALEAMFPTPSPFERLESATAVPANQPFPQRLEMAD